VSEDLCQEKLQAAKYYTVGSLFMEQFWEEQPVHLPVVFVKIFNPV
jgi:hypothetical protein